MNAGMPRSSRRVIRRKTVIGMQGRQEQVAGLRGLDGDLRRFLVANLADHDDVGVLTQESIEGCANVSPALLLTWT